MARALLTAQPYSVAKYRSRAYGAAVRDELRKRPDVVVVDHAQACSALDAVGAATPVVLVAHNAEGKVYARLAEEHDGGIRRRLNAREGRLLEAIEGDLARRASQIWTLTASDATYFRSLFASADVRTLAAASMLGEPPSDRRPERDVALLGSWTWRANAAGLDWFCDEVVPHLPDGMRVEVAGAGSERVQGRQPSLFVRGVVPDAPAFLSRARVVAVPAVAGGGMQIKLLDAIASGAAVVATPLALRGLDDVPATVAVADDGAEFAHELGRFAATGVDAAAQAEAMAWSAARRARLRAELAAWIGEVGGDRQESERALAAERAVAWRR
jgi:hypothetical protein